MIAEQKKQSEEDRVFYDKIWATRPHFCQVCTTWLGNVLKKLFFDHLLEKSKYPELRYEERNIALVCGTCHACKSDGHPKPIHKELIERAKEVLLS